MDFLKSTVKQTAVSALVYAALGVYFILKPDTAFVTIGKILAIAILIIGLAEIAMYFSEKNFLGLQRNGLTAGLVISIFSVFLLVKPEFAATLVGFALGFAVILAGIIQFQNALDLRHFSQPNWPVLLITGLIEIILGVVALIDPFGADRTLIFVIGIFLCICAVCKLVSIILVGKGLHGLKKAAKEAAQEADAVDMTEASEDTEKDGSTDDARYEEDADDSDTAK